MKLKRYRPSDILYAIHCDMTLDSTRRTSARRVVEDIYASGPFSSFRALYRHHSLGICDALNIPHAPLPPEAEVAAKLLAEAVRLGVQPQENG